MSDHDSEPLVGAAGPHDEHLVLERVREEQWHTLLAAQQRLLEQELEATRNRVRQRFQQIHNIRPRPRPGAPEAAPPPPYTAAEQIIQQLRQENLKLKQNNLVHQKNAAVYKERIAVYEKNAAVHKKETDELSRHFWLLVIGVIVSNLIVYYYWVLWCLEAAVCFLAKVPKILVLIWDFIIGVIGGVWGFGRVGAASEIHEVTKTVTIDHVHPRVTVTAFTTITTAVGWFRG